MARRSQVEMLYMNEEKKEAQSLLGSLDGRLQQMRDQAVEQVECMQAALETAISLHRAELEIQLEVVFVCNLFCHLKAHVALSGKTVCECSRCGK